MRGILNVGPKLNYTVKLAVMAYCIAGLALSNAVGAEGLTSAAGSPPAPQPDQSKPNPENAAPAYLDEEICKTREEPITGTRISRKRQVCHTRREWLQEAQVAQDTLNKIQESGRASNGIAGGRKGGGGS
ncbi:MAG: hypothetical protein K8S25_15685 [Alphaproteobacteria bacterium]|nr:hypothetical protein [Alphaproteobacteria bacterium]